MKLFISITGALEAIGCAVWAYLLYASRNRVVLYKMPFAGSESEPT